jgi:hypothetical protein
MTAVAAAYGADRATDPAALTNGFSAAFTGAAAIALLGVAVVAITFRRQQTRVAASTDDQRSEPVVSR